MRLNCPYDGERLLYSSIIGSTHSDCKPTELEFSISCSSGRGCHPIRLGIVEQYSPELWNSPKFAIEVVDKTRKNDLGWKVCSRIYTLRFLPGSFIALVWSASGMDIGRAEIVKHPSLVPRQ